MSFPLPVIYISRLQHYSCMMCGWCCRRFRVLLTEPEVERIKRLDWGDESGVPQDFCEMVNGSPYFRRDARGCLFLDDNGVCLMHRKFGFAKKALTCRGYPFNIVSTFPGEVSVLARMDCPAVLRGHGAALTEQASDIRQLVSELRFGSGFTAAQLCGMSRKGVEALRDECMKIVRDVHLTMAECARLLMSLALRCERLGGVFLSDMETMAKVYPSLVEGLRAELPKAPLYSGFGGLGRLYFRQHLTSYCRRDEELRRTGLPQRLHQAWSIARVMAGGGNLKTLGEEHPDCGMRRARIFRRESGSSLREVWEVYRRFLLVRLETWQFFGAAYYDLDFFGGLRALFLTYPIVLALSRVHCHSRGGLGLEAEDVMYGVCAMDHVHGRSAALAFRTARVREAYLSARFSQLVHALGEG